MSQYVHHTLMAGEKVLIDTNPHKIMFVWPLIIVIFAMLAPLVTPFLETFRFVLFRNLNLGDILGIILGIFGLWNLIKTVIQFNTYEYVITNKRVVMKTGLLSVHALEILLSRIEAIHVNQSLSGRIYGYGSLVLVGVGGSRDYFMYVPNPFDFRQCIQDMRLEPNDTYPENMAK